MRTVEDLNEKELTFCELYTSLGEPTCGNQTASARVVGYSEPARAAWRLMQRPVIREKIKELHSARMERFSLSADRVLFDLEDCRVRALEKSDLATACRCSELHGKYLALFVDRMDVDTMSEERVKLTEQEQKAARELAGFVLTRQLDRDRPELTTTNGRTSARKD